VYSTHSETSDCKSPGQCCDTIPYDGFISIVSYIYIYRDRNHRAWRLATIQVILTATVRAANT